MLARYYITDRHGLGGVEALVENIAHWLREGITMVQLREKDLSMRELLALARRVRALPNPHGTKILINDRLDVALAVGLDGVHLRGGAPAPSGLRDSLPDGFLIGVSCHSLDDVQRASSADFVVLGPVFESLSKPGYGPVIGLDGIQRASAIRPVYALGGVTESNAAACIDSGAVGIAAITLFQRPT
ncbi:MAG: thiamine phosphate synthase [Bryobacteraceae bacterium]|nr:thiamine phosphate synthase [Bryobacteraceae bacterium]